MATKRSSSLNSAICCNNVFHWSFEVSSSLSKQEVARNCSEQSSRMCLKYASVLVLESNRSDSPCKAPQNKLRAPSGKHLMGGEKNASPVFKFLSWIL